MWVKSSVRGELNYCGNTGVMGPSVGQRGTVTRVQFLSPPFCNLPCQPTVPAAASGVPKESSRTVLPVVILRILPHSCGAALTVGALLDTAATGCSCSRTDQTGQTGPSQRTKGRDRSRGQGRVGPAAATATHWQARFSPPCPPPSPSPNPGT